MSSPKNIEAKITKIFASIKDFFGAGDKNYVEWDQFLVALAEDETHPN